MDHFGRDVGVGLYVPVKWGFLAFPGVDILDVYGPIEMLYLVAANRHLSVKIITPSDANIVVSPPMGNRYNSTYSPEVVGAATMDEDLDLDIFVVPGGAAARDPDLGYVDDYVAAKMPSLRYLHTICTGAIFAARAGVLDGRRATTNKNAWDLVTAHGNNVTWVAPARYVIDGNIWSSSGVTSGMDMTVEFVRQFYGEDIYNRILLGTEIVPRAHDDDPYTDIVGIPHQGQL
ncbi:hypothetical protein N3K66_007362 [Trichothecium roseum]|uniref:Uncharacterized protein n=1 Tax=Trichothecium roseum TaxID=47278 RepID=A0ACC0UTS1_9HYPO|nr:hypothetical protein N3K66_007362 [Trichothecium roseum]